MRIIQCIVAFMAIFFNGTNLRAFMPAQTNQISEENLKAAGFVFLGEVQSLELISATLSDQKDVPRRVVRVKVLLSHYWKPEKVDAHSVFVYLNFPGDYGIPKICLGYRFFVLGDILENGVYYARSGSSAFYSYSSVIETYLEGDPISNPRSFADSNLILLNKFLGKPKEVNPQGQP